MPKIEGSTYTADIEWDKDGRPVLYVTGRGNAISAKEAIEVVQKAVETINAGPFDRVCSVYNLFGTTHIPLPIRFISAGKIPSSPRTAHIVMGTTSSAMKLVASLMAVSGSQKARSFDVCETPEDMEAAVQRWISANHLITVPSQQATP